MRRHLLGSALLLVLGAAVLYWAVAVAPPSGDVHAYEAKEVTHDDNDRVTLTSVHDDETDRAPIGDLDEAILCDIGGSLECTMVDEYLERGQPLPESTGSRFEFIASRGSVYRIQPRAAPDEQFVETDASTVFESVATAYGDVDDPAQAAIDDGRVTTERASDDIETLIERNGRYYVVDRVGYSSSDGVCVSSGASGFCDGDAEEFTRWQWGKAVLAGAAGLAGVVVGIVGLFPYLPYNLRRRIVDLV